MSLLINNASSGLQALAKALQYSTPSPSPPSANTNVQKPDWQIIQSQSASSWKDQASYGLNVSYSYTTSNVVKTDLSLVGSSVTGISAPSDGGGVSSVTTGYDLTMSDIDNS